MERTPPASESAMMRLSIAWPSQTSLYMDCATLIQAAGVDGAEAEVAAGRSRAAADGPSSCRLKTQDSGLQTLLANFPAADSILKGGSIRGAGDNKGSEVPTEDSAKMPGAIL